MEMEESRTWLGRIQCKGLYLVPASLSEAERSNNEEDKVDDTSESVSASDVPELVVFIQESDYKSVKDIFIHREVPTWSGSLNNKDGGSSDSEEPRKTLRIFSSISSEIEHDFHNYVRKKHGLDNLMKDGEEVSNRKDTHLLDKPAEKIIPGRQHMKEFQNGDSVSSNRMEPSPAESIDDESLPSEVSSHTEAAEAESGRSTIQFCDSSTVMCSLKEFLEGQECHQRVSRSLNGYPNQSIGDSGSFAVSPIPFSGLIPSSSSVSLRSTGSTASNHSFAFPILPSEWNGSPVRMVKADQPEPRKLRNWRTYFLCCI